MNSTPLFSIIIPTYHRNALLAKCLDCLAPGMQKLPPQQYEVIVSDDGSETTAEEMIRERYPWANWVLGSRKGPAANRNNGAKYAQGEWLIFTDDDCLPDSSWLSGFAEAIAADIQVYEGKTTCEVGIHSPLEYAPVNLTGGYLWSCNMMIRANLFQNLGGFDEAFPYAHMEDVDLRERIKLAGYYIKFVPNSVVDHPPKRLPWGDKLGETHESEVYYWQRKQQQPISRRSMLYTILKFRLAPILNYRFGLDSFKALISLVVEFLYVYFHFDRWQNKHEL